MTTCNDERSLQKLLIVTNVIFDHSETRELKQVVHCGVYIYHDCDWSTAMGGITIAPTDIWSIHCYGEERNMRRQGDDRLCVRIRQGHRCGRETDWNPDSVTGARNRSAEMENLWLDIKACREDSEGVFHYPAEKWSDSRRRCRAGRAGASCWRGDYRRQVHPHNTPQTCLFPFSSNW